ncbi:MAG: hypothetical protein U0326_28555 [Polyangiales bacterium]
MDISLNLLRRTHGPSDDPSRFFEDPSDLALIDALLFGELARRQTEDLKANKYRRPAASTASRGDARARASTGSWAGAAWSSGASSLDCSSRIALETAVIRDAVPGDPKEERAHRRNGLSLLEGQARELQEQHFKDVVREVFALRPLDPEPHEQLEHVGGLLPIDPLEICRRVVVAQDDVAHVDADRHG